MPDEIAGMLNDPSLFSSNTTKDILKRFHELQGRPPVPASDFKEVYNKQDMSTRPPPRRVDTDPSLWQQESSVRPVLAPPLPSQNSSSSAGGGYRGREEAAHGKLERSDTQHTAEHDPGQTREWRNSGWGRQGGVAMGHD